jgi:hypothetical protein
MLTGVQRATMDAEEAECKLAATKELRYHLRRALDAANKSHRYACQFSMSANHGLGVYGLIDAALGAMGDTEAIEQFCDSGEWDDDEVGPL